MTLAEIRQYISYLVDDLDQTYFTPVQLNRFINQSLREAQKLLILAGNNWYVKLVQRQTVANQRDYKLPCDFLYLNRLELRSSDDNPPPNSVDRQSLDALTLNQQEEFATYAQPVGYYFEKDYLILCPAPQDNTKFMWLWYSYLVDEVSGDNDIPDLPVEYHEYLAQKAAGLCFVKDDRAMDNILPLVKDTEMRLEKAAIERAQSHASKVVRTRGDGYISY